MPEHMPEDIKPVVPVAVVDPDQLRDVMARLEKIEEKFSKTNSSLKANVTLYVGGLEFLNKVLYSTRSFYTALIKRKYTDLAVKKDEIGNANHFSIRKPAIDRIFESLKD